MHLKIGKIKGITISLHISTLIIIGLVGFYAGSFYDSMSTNVSLTELIFVGVINGFIMLLSILLHELAHSLWAQKYELEVSEIELHLFGGISKIEKEPQNPKNELIISAVGPLSSLLIGASFLLLYFSGLTFPNFLLVTFLFSGITNVGLGLFNFLPAFPMDGGRVLRAYLWNKRGDILSATKTSTKIASFFGYGMILYGFFQTIFFGLLGGFWLIIIGMFLNSTAKKAYIQTFYELQLSQIKADEILRTPKLAIPFNTLVDDAVRYYFMVYRYPYFPIVRNGRIIGIVHINAIKNIPEGKRRDYIIGYLMRDIEEFPEINLNDKGDDVLRKLRKNEEEPLLGVVMDEDKMTKEKHIAGFIGEEDLNSALKYMRMVQHPTS
ncbi:MAG: site-2 protease family protein [Promethearchaeia archaeon]